MLSRSLSVPCSQVATGLVYTPSLDLTVLTLNVVTCVATQRCHCSITALLLLLEHGACHLSQLSYARCPCFDLQHRKHRRSSWNHGQVHDC